MYEALFSILIKGSEKSSISIIGIPANANDSDVIFCNSRIININRNFN